MIYQHLESRGRHQHIRTQANLLENKPWNKTELVAGMFEYRFFEARTVLFNKGAAKVFLFLEGNIIIFLLLCTCPVIYMQVTTLQTHSFT